MVSTAPANGSRKLEPGEAEELGAMEGGFEWREEPTEAVELTAMEVGVEEWESPVAKLVAPTDASATAPNMMIDTTMANPTARLRGDRWCAFILYLGGWVGDVPRRPLQE
jgi:hypothetical protein